MLKEISLLALLALLDRDGILREKFVTRPPFWSQLRVDLVVQVMPDQPEEKLYHKFRVPTTVARLCAEAAFLGPYNFYHVYRNLNEDPNSDTYGIAAPPRYVELLGTDGVLTADDLVNKGCLYFSIDWSQREPPPEGLVELRGRAWEIFVVDPSTFNLEAQTYLAKFGFDANDLSTLLARIPVMLDHVMAPTERWSTTHVLPFNPPPRGPLPQAGDAIASLELKLPLGYYKGPTTSFADAVIRQLDALEMKLDEAQLDLLLAGSDPAAACERLVTQLPELRVHVVSPDFKTPEVYFGSCACRDVWIVHLREGFYAPLFSPRPILAQKFWQDIRGYLWNNNCDKMTFLQLVAKKWDQIVALPSATTPLLARVKTRVREFVELLVLDIIFANETVPTNTGYGTAAWNAVMSQFCAVLGFDLANRDYTTLICDAFHLVLAAHWQSMSEFRMDRWCQIISTGLKKDRLLEFSQVQTWISLWEPFYNVLKALMHPADYTIAQETQKSILDALLLIAESLGDFGASRN